MSLRNAVRAHRLKEEEPACFFSLPKGWQVCFRMVLAFAYSRLYVHSNWVLVARFGLLMLTATNEKRNGEWRCLKQRTKEVLYAWVAHCPYTVRVMYLVVLLIPGDALESSYICAFQDAGLFYARGTFSYMCVITMHRRVSEFCNSLCYCACTWSSERLCTAAFFSIFTGLYCPQPGGTQKTSKMGQGLRRAMDARNQTLTHYLLNTLATH